MENDGSGTFTEILEIPFFDGSAFSLSEMNNDGELDLVVYIFPNRLAILLNQGGLNFAAPVFYNLQIGTVAGRGPAVGDFNGDGFNDVCVSTSNTLFGTTPQTVDLFINDGRGVLTSGEILNLPSRGLGVAFIDLDKDGDQDLATSGLNTAGEDCVFVFTNDGDGNYSEPAEFAAGVWASIINYSDVDNDTNIDLVLSGGFSNPTILFGNGDGTFEPPMFFGPTDGIYRPCIGILDLNGDFHKELITGRGAVNFVDLFLNDGGRNFGQEFEISFGFSPNGIAVGDFNDDGVEDAAVTHSAGNLEILFVDCETILLGDVNLDGELNLLDVNPFVELLLSGKFQAEADINRDGVVDLLDVGPFTDLLLGG